MSSDLQLLPIVFKEPADSGLEIESMQSISNVFQPFFAKAEEWRQKALQCKVTDPTDKRGMKFARESRLALRQIRIDIENKRKAAKEDSLRRGKVIDGFANILKGAIEPIEAFLLEQEEFAERMEAARIARLNEERRALLAPYGVQNLAVVLGEMSQADFDSMLADAKSLFEARQERLQREEKERADRELREALEAERLRQENARLRQEAKERELAAAAERQRLEAERAAAEKEAREKSEAAEALARAERQAAEQKAAAERAARETAEMEARALREAEERRLREEEARRVQAAAEKAEAERRAANAPDKDKLVAFAQSVRALQVPECSTPEAKQAASEVAAKVESFARWIEAAASKL